MCLSWAILSGSVNAQTNFDKFWIKFRSAVTRSDRATVASLTKFPFSLGYDPRAKGGEGFIKTKANFLRQYKYIFNSEVNAIKCFKGSTPEKEGKNYSVACSFKQEPANAEKPFIYTFTPTRLGWRFAGFENINE